jgi:hypothetical protein
LTAVVTGAKGFKGLVAQSTTNSVDQLLSPNAFLAETLNL